MNGLFLEQLGSAHRVLTVPFNYTDTLLLVSKT